MSGLLIPRLRCKLCKKALEDDGTYVWCPRCKVMAVLPRAKSPLVNTAEEVAILSNGLEMFDKCQP